MTAIVYRNLVSKKRNVIGGLGLMQISRDLRN